MRFTLTAAAKETGVSKGTVSKALKSGRLSGERQEDGSFQIEASELFRVFPQKPQKPAAETAQKPQETAGEPTETGVELAVLRVRLEIVEQERERERESAQATIEDLRRRLDAEQEERRNLQRQIMPPAGTEKPQDRPSTVSARVEPSRSQKGFLGRFWSR